MVIRFRVWIRFGLSVDLPSQLNLTISPVSILLHLTPLPGVYDNKPEAQRTAYADLKRPEFKDAVVTHEHLQKVIQVAALQGQFTHVDKETSKVVQEVQIKALREAKLGSRTHKKCDTIIMDSFNW